MIDLNEYLASFLGANLSDKIDATKLNEIILNIMINIWYKQAYVQGFDSKSISFKKDVNIYECMEILEYIYEGVVEPSYKKPTCSDVNRSGCIRHKRGEAASSWTRLEKGERAVKLRKRHVDSPTFK